MTLTSSGGQRRNRLDLPLLEIAAFVMIIAAVIIFLVQLSTFSSTEQRLPFGLEMAGVPVGGDSREQAVARVEQVYGQPVSLGYPISCAPGQSSPCLAESAALQNYPISCPDGEDVQCIAELPLEPANLGVRINSQAMLSAAEGRRDAGSFWPRFWDYLWRKPSPELAVDLSMEYSQEQLQFWLQDVAVRFDLPPQAAQAVLSELSFQRGTPGYTLNVEESLLVVDEVLRRPIDRSAELVVERGRGPEPTLDALQELLVAYLTQPELQEIMSRALVLNEFDIVASIFVIDLQSGEEMDLNVNFGTAGPIFYDYDIAYSGASVVKIPILAEMLRHISWTPSADELEIITQTMTRSSNFNANLMLFEIGDGSPTRGLQTLNQSMNFLGLENTFVGVEYDYELDGQYYATEARECARTGQCINTRADYNRQTTSRDIATLLNMVYQCATTGGGGLMLAYPGEFTQSECQLMIDSMTQNLEGVLIYAGVPQGTPVAHKHGWIDDTFADAGIVRSQGGDYVLVMFMWADAPRLDPVGISFPVMKTISEATYNYFNPDEVGTPRIGTVFEEGFEDPAPILNQGG